MKNTVVADTGPLIALSVIGKLDILRFLFKTVSVPEAVHKEMLQGGHANRGVALYQNSSWIQIRHLSDPPDPLIRNALDAGEAALICLARECKADMVLIDERKGRKIARDIYNLRVIGTAGILVEAKQKGIIPNVRNLLTEMCDSGYRIHDNIVELALRKANEIS